MIGPMDYAGYNGTISLTDDDLTITHSGLGAKVGGLAKNQPRSIPLQAISGVHFKQATRLVNGHIKLGLGGNGATDPGMNAPSDPDALLFRHKNNEQFKQLHEQLLAIIDDNRRAGVDPSTIEFAAAAQTREQRLQQAADESVESVAQIKDQRLSQQTDKMSAMLGEDRPDIVAAAARMGWRMGGKRELKQLAGHLYEGETVRFIAQGTYQDDQGIVVLTDGRLLFLFHGVMRQAKEDFPLRLISSVQTESGMVTGELRITVSGASSSISGIVKSDLQPLADALRQGMSAQQAAPAQPQASAPAPPDVTDQIRKLAELHAAGVLTDEEFNAKKAELLDRL